MAKKQSKKTFAQIKSTEYVRDITSIGNPIILGFISLVSLGFSIELLLIAIGLVVNDTIGFSIKYFFPKARPNKLAYTTTLEKIEAGSFPSVHSSRTSFVLFSLAFLTEDWVVKVGLLLAVLTVGYSRVFLKKHFWVDVLAGYVLGVLLFLGFWFIVN